MSKHLDLGCGYNPRNPLNQENLYGCDILANINFSDSKFRYVMVDIVGNRLPFEDNYFDSISAFDFIEHVPRYSIGVDGKSYSPFIFLMSEIYRILKPEGVFLASTPAYPHAAAFQDPTHVNIITTKTHEYFCGDDAYAKRYGFKGQFKARKIKFEVQKNISDRTSSELLKKLRNLHRMIFKGGLPHLTWELVAYKNLDNLKNEQR